MKLLQALVSYSLKTYHKKILKDLRPKGFKSFFIGIKEMWGKSLLVK